MNEVIATDRTKVPFMSKSDANFERASLFCLCLFVVGDNNEFLPLFPIGVTCSIFTKYFIIMVTITANGSIEMKGHPPSKNMRYVTADN